MITEHQERIEPEAGQNGLPFEPPPELRVLTPAEVAVVAGGPQTQNDQDIG